VNARNLLEIFIGLMVPVWAAVVRFRLQPAAALELLRERARDIRLDLVVDGLVLAGGQATVADPAGLHAALDELSRATPASVRRFLDRPPAAGEPLLERARRETLCVVAAYVEAAALPWAKGSDLHRLHLSAAPLASAGPGPVVR